MDKNCTYIVTGCTGFVGNVFAKKLMQAGCKVVGFARSEKKVERVFPEEKPQFIYGDITNADDVERLFVGEGPFVVLHTAAQITIGEGDQALAEKVTVEGARNIVNSCLRHNVKKLLHVSSTEALPEELSTDGELTSYNPNPEGMKRGYARSKTMADKLVLDAAKEHGLNASLMLFACVLGAGDYGMGHMSQLLSDFVGGKLPASIKAGYNVFDVNDVADVLFEIIEKSKAGESYLFANQTRPINDILQAASAVTGRKLPVTLPVWVAYLGLPFLSVYFKIIKKRPLYTATALKTLKRNSNFSIEKAKREFGYSPRPMEDTVAEHVNFLIENGMAQVKK